jgi:hypothetical protein
MVPVLRRWAKGKSKKENGPPFLRKARDGKESAQTIRMVHRLMLATTKRMRARLPDITQGSDPRN